MLDGLMKPPTTSYPTKCGVNIHLNQTPTEREESLVTTVRYQVPEIKDGGVTAAYWFGDLAPK
jgi:hypothetical protein